MVNLKVRRSLFQPSKSFCFCVKVAHSNSTYNHCQRSWNTNVSFPRPLAGADLSSEGPLAKNIVWGPKSVIFFVSSF